MRIDRRRGRPALRSSRHSRPSAYPFDDPALTPPVHWDESLGEGSTSMSGPVSTPLAAP